MNIGSLYTVKKYYWLLFPAKKTACTPPPPAALYLLAANVASIAADYWSRRYNCEVTYFCPDSIVVFLEEDGNYKKVLTSDGKIGWIWFAEEYYNDCFEEVKANP
jgi:hypothetical protein